MKTLCAAALALGLALAPAFAAVDATDEPALRDFSPDRPSKSFSPFTVPTGHVQVEMDLASYAHGNLGPSGLLQTADPVLKYGLANRLDIEVQIGGYLQQWSRAAGVGHTSGFGDVTGLAKLNLLGDDGGDVILAAIPYVKIPTATANLGNGRVEYGVIAPLLFNLPHKMTLGFQVEIDALKNTNDGGMHGNLAGAINLGFALTEHLAGFVELYAARGADAAIRPIYTGDTGLSYALTPTLALDAGVNIGLNRDAPNLVVYTGIAKRF